MGAEILEEYGWIATRTPLGRPTGICLPNDIGRFAYVSLIFMSSLSLSSSSSSKSFNCLELLLLGASKKSMLTTLD